MRATIYRFRQVILMCLIVLCAIGKNSVLAMELQGSELTKEDKRWAEDLAASSRLQGLAAIKDKWEEYQKMLEESDISVGTGDYMAIASQTDLHSGAKGGNLRVFVSKSMGKNLLKVYAKEAAKYDAVLVFNGLPNGSWLELSYLVQEIADDREVAMQIDDEAFKTYGITSVPSFVLSERVDELAALDGRGELQRYDKVSGNIGIRRALEIITEEGELGEIADLLLKGNI